MVKSPTFPNGLKEAMKRSGVGPSELSREINTNRQNVTRWAAGDRKLTVPWAKKMAPILDTTPEELLLPGARAVQRVALLDWISAGNLAESGSQDFSGSEAVPAVGLDPKGDWIALKVVGSSMDRISPPESVIFVNRRDRRLVPNGCYVIADEAGEATYKRYRPDPRRFEPVSTDAGHETLFPDEDPVIIGRVRRTVLDL